MYNKILLFFLNSINQFRFILTKSTRSVIYRLKKWIDSVSFKGSAEKKAGNDTEPGLTSGAGSSKQPSAVPSEENSLQEAPPKEPNSSSEPATSGPNYAFIVSNDVV